jgi:hypothetical protein
MKPVIGCAAILLIACAASFFLVAGMSYANGRKAAQEAAALIPSEYVVPTGSPTETPTATLEEWAQTATADFFVTASATPTLTITPSETITDTPTPFEVTEEATPIVIQQRQASQPQIVERTIREYVYITQPAPAPVVVTRRVVVTGQPIIITARPTSTPTATDEPETTPEITPEVTIEPSPTATETLTETPMATKTMTETPTETPTLTETPTETATHTPTFTETPTETWTPLPILTDLPTMTPMNERPTAGPTWDGTQTYALDN